MFRKKFRGTPGLRTSGPARGDTAGTIVHRRPDHARFLCYFNHGAYTRKNTYDIIPHRVMYTTRLSLQHHGLVYIFKTYGCVYTRVIRIYARVVCASAAAAVVVVVVYYCRGDVFILFGNVYEYNCVTATSA